MTIAVRPYRPETDYEVVAEFLIDAYRSDDRLAVWLQPRWEYMFSHTSIDDIDLTRIGIAEADGGVIGVVHPEHSMAFAYLQIHPDHPGVAVTLIDWAERHLGGWSNTLEDDVLAIVTDHPVAERIMRERCYQLSDFREPHGSIDLEDPLPSAPLPRHYRLQSLADDNNPRQINRVLWRGFDHPGQPPDDHIPGRIRAQQTPNYALDLNVVAVAPAGDFVSYAGIWVEPTHYVAYLEPVATDPDHRRRGLGRAVVTECLNRARERGARVAWVGSDQEFYAGLGFRVTCTSRAWVTEPKRPHPPSNGRQEEDI